MKRGICMKRVFKFITITLCICLIMMPLCRANAYVLIEGKLDLESKFVPSKNFTDLTYSHMNEALWQWNKTAGKTIFSISYERHSNDNDSQWGYDRPKSTDNGVNEIFKEVRNDISYVGETAISRVEYSNIFTKWIVIEEADILINVKHKFANSAQSGAYDTWSIFLHEAGHALGLDDNPNSTYGTSVMYPYAKTNVTKRYLLNDDIQGVKAKKY